MPTVADSWKQIEAWLSRHAPRILKNLNPPTRPSELEAAAQEFGCEMPTDWKDLYLAHDGMNSDGNLGSLFCGMQFLPLAEAIREHSESKLPNITPFPVRKSDSGVRTADMQHAKWIPFAHDGGATLLRIDLDPGVGGVAGQVIFTDHDHDVVIVLAPSLREFLAGFVSDLAAGNYFLNQEALQSGDEFLNCAKEIDVVNWAHSPRWKHLK